MRLAVLLGGVGVPVARLDHPGGQPVSLAGAGEHRAGSTALAVAQVRRAGRAQVVDELVVACPTRWTAAQVRQALSRFEQPGRPLAGRVRGCPVALGLARELRTRVSQPPGPLAVLEHHPHGLTVTVFADLDRATVLASRDVRPATRLASALAGACVAAGVAAAELTGGLVVGHPGPDVAELEELVDLAGQRPELATDPDGLAVLGALRSSTARDAPPGSRRPLWPDGEPLGLSAGPPEPGHRGGAALLGVGMPVLAALLALLVVREPGWAARGSTPGPPPTRLLAQYDYSLVAPVGWRHSGGLPARRRTLLTPDQTPNGSEVISVEQTPLGYDSSAEPDRALREFQARFAAERAAGALLDRFTLSTRIGGRNAIGYRQRQPARDTEVDWYVLFERDAELSVGCQHTPTGAVPVAAACAQVVASLRPRPR